MKYFLILFIPFNVFAAHDCVFSPPCNARINEAALLTAIQTQAPTANLIFDSCAGDFALNGVVQPGTAIPSKLTVSGIPDEVTCQQVQTFLVNHNPAETTQEERQRKIAERRESQLQATQTIQDILQRLDALEAP